MDTANDNPLKRFSSFWLAVVLFGSFGLIGLLMAPWFRKPVEDSYDAVNAERRNKIRVAVMEEQSGARQAAAKSFEKLGAALLAAEPTAVESDGQLLPGSPTAVAKTAGGATGIVVPPDFPRVPDDTPVDPAVMEVGKVAFNTCLACHGPTGDGIPSLGPPLAGSEWVLGPVENLIAIQLRGLIGPIEVKGQTYTPVAPMPPQSFQTDEQIAAVITFVRNSFGNQASPVTAEQVAALRGEVGKPMLTSADLIPPAGGKAPAAQEGPTGSAPKPAPTVKPKAEPAPVPEPTPAPETEPKAVAATEDKIDPAVMAEGKTQFNLCMACHGPEGQGVPNLAPPLAGSEWVNGPAENLIRIQLRGLIGPIEVKGTTYKLVAPMVPQAFQTDQQVAAVLTYVRNSFGNKAPQVSPKEVAALRGEVGKPMLTQADLIPPK